MARGPIAPLLGWDQPYAGRAVTVAAPEVHRADTGMVCGLYPFLYGSSLPPIGAFLGYNVLTGRAFSCHPLLWVVEQIVANPNLLITGAPGSGKSATVKALATRLIALGIRVLIAGDIKGEYNHLCRWMGVEPLELGPGLKGRLNPLDAGPLGSDLDRITDPVELKTRLTEIHRRRLSLLAALLELQMRRPLLPEEAEAISLAVKEVTGQLAGNSTLVNPTLRAVHAMLLDPTPAMARELRIRGEDIQATRESVRSARAALGAMVDGHVGGIFDTESSTVLDWDAPIASVDISRMESYGEDVVAMIMTCVSSWAQAAVDQPSGPQRMVVRDELWRVMNAGPSMVKKIDSDLRLSRNDGVIQTLATHRLADFEAVGAAGSAAVAIARNMISSCDTRITLAQDVRPLAEIQDAVGLTDAQVDLVSSWGRAHVGRALWTVGRAGSHPVQLHLTPTELELFHTDEKMAV
ncbi:helicase HerA domain-containing protein [Kitasatospora aburaviensis]